MRLLAFGASASEAARAGDESKARSAKTDTNRGFMREEFSTLHFSLATWLIEIARRRHNLLATRLWAIRRSRWFGLGETGANPVDQYRPIATAQPPRHGERYPEEPEAPCVAHELPCWLPPARESARLRIAHGNGGCNAEHQKEFVAQQKRHENQNDAQYVKERLQAEDYMAECNTCAVTRTFLRRPRCCAIGTWQRKGGFRRGRGRGRRHVGR